MKKFLLFSILFTAYLGFAQQDSLPQTNLDSGTLEEQFQYLLRRGENYNVNGIRYEVIKLNNLNKFYKNLQDSILIANRSLSEIRSTIAENTTEIDGLKSRLSETSENLQNLTQEKDTMPFFGAMVSKGTYNGIVWTMILVLLFLLLIFIYKFRNGNYVTQQAKSALANLEEEFEQHRRRALEREQKISRQLHDEINKQKSKK